MYLGFLKWNKSWSTLESVAENCGGGFACSALFSLSRSDCLSWVCETFVRLRRVLFRPAEALFVVGTSSTGAGELAGGGRVEGCVTVDDNELGGGDEGSFCAGGGRDGGDSKGCGDDGFCVSSVDCVGNDSFLDCSFLD